jgi:hypothetical protein
MQSIQSMDWMDCMDWMDKSRVASGIECEAAGRLKKGCPRHREGAKKSLGALAPLAPWR